MYTFIPLREAPNIQLAQFETAETLTVVPSDICPWDEAEVSEPSTVIQDKLSVDSMEHKFVALNAPSDADNISASRLFLAQGKVNVGEDLRTRFKHFIYFYI